MRILLIEDAEDLGDAIAARLRQSGHAVEWITDGNDAGDRLRDEEFDAIVLDIMLPGRDGFGILRDLRRAKIETPVLVITARSEVDDKVSLLDLGADDYLVKPFDLREFEARLRAITRRPAGFTVSEIRIGALTLDTANRQTLLNGHPLELGRREFRILEILATRAGQVAPKGRLMTQVFDLDEDVSVNALELHISRLRRKLEGSNVEIVTVRGLGYTLRVHDGG